MKQILIFALLFSAFTSVAQKKQAYVIYNAEGKKVSYEKMMKTLVQQDLVFFGEYHNNPISHWLQLEFCKDIIEKRPMVLGAEMFEADNQRALDQYLAGEIDAKGLDTLARLWRNYKTDYAPLVNFAKEHQAAFAATNIPRRFAAKVFSDGFEALDSLNAEEKSWVAPLPLAYDPDLPGYKSMLTMMSDHASPNLPKAQACKDATMAHFILKYYKPGSLFLHFNGSYHSDNHEGIVWYVRHQRPDMKISTVTTVSQANTGKLEKENHGLADFIICVDEDMTSTY